MIQQFWKGRRVFLTGHTGFEGAWLSLWLQQLGAELTGYSLCPPSNPSLFDVAQVEEGMISVIGDVRDAQAVSRAMKAAMPEIVIHMAAQSMVRDGYLNPVETYATNVMGTVHVLDAARMTPSVRVVINVTTDKCYESRDGHWIYRESDSMGGIEPYSNSKACSELVTLAYQSSYFNPGDYSKHGVAIATVRAGNVIGGGDWGRYRLIPDMIRAIEVGAAVNIRSPHALRPWQHVLEPLSAYLLLAERLHVVGTKYGGPWNFSANDEDIKPVQWVADRLISLWGEGASWTLDANPQEPEAFRTKLDCSKAKADLGWHPRWDLEMCLVKLVEWHKSHIDGLNMRDVTLRHIASFLEDEKKLEVSS